MTVKLQSRGEQPRRKPIGQPPRRGRDQSGCDGPGRHQEAGRGLRAAQRILEEEGQRDQGKGLGGERADRGRKRQRENRAAQKIDRKKRRGLLQLAADKHRADRRRGGDFGERGKEASLFANSIDADDQEAEGQHVEDHAERVEAPNRARRLGQGSRSEHQRRHADRNVDEEEPSPGSDRKNCRSDARASR